MNTVVEKTQRKFELAVIAPGGLINQKIVIAACRAGALGILDLEHTRDKQEALIALENIAVNIPGNFGIKLDGYAFEFWSELLLELPKATQSAVLTYSDKNSLKVQVEALRKQGLKVILEATSLEEARAGKEAGVDELIAKGNEAGGRVDEKSTFILLQQLLRNFLIPVWAHGGIGLHTVAACYAAGAAGTVLDWQLALVRESSFPEDLKSLLAKMDGSESVCIGQSLGRAYRVYAKPSSPALIHLQEEESRLGLMENKTERLIQWHNIIAQYASRKHFDGLLLIGQDIVFASILNRRFRSVAGLLYGLRCSITEHCQIAKELRPLNEDSTLAKAHNTRYPIVQGPMSRISDTPAFAAAIAEAGGLPFIALGMMSTGEIKPILEDIAVRLNKRSWGVGLLGFIDKDFLEKQLEIVRKINPPFALIAGGRPEQVRALQAGGTTTYLHVPSHRLLKMEIEEGMKHFIFEGRECGGHVGPLSSFTLWEASIEILLEMIPERTEGSEYHVLFAGGIHDALSCAMVGVLAATLAKRGVRIGVLLGTAYLFTKEAVETGAICEDFQKTLFKETRTVLLESGGGHTTRCANSEFVRVFEKEKQRLQLEGKTPQEMRKALELLNLGRLRIAAKGVAFNPESLKDINAPAIVNVSKEAQAVQGLYMVGEVVALHDSSFGIPELHQNIAKRGSEYLAVLSVPQHTNAPAQERKSAKVAIIGMSCILPKAGDLKTYWENIVNKVNAITEIPSERWDWSQYYDPDPKKKDSIYSKWGGFIDPIAFEPTVYGMPPNSMKSIDPCQILALEVVRLAMQDAGYLNREFDREHTSVIFGASGGLGDYGSLYAIRSLLPLFIRDISQDVFKQLPEWTEDSFPGLLLNVISGRIANNFNFGGVNFAVDAACASSLAAVYHAVRELTVGSSNMVIVGGVDTAQNPFTYLCFGKSQALSPTGCARTFDSGADGIVTSEGIACVVLKRLEDARRDGDRIYAVIDGIGGSSDGKGKSLTAPLPEGQARALKQAYESAGISPASVELIEAHGTGTVAGDRAEATSLDMVFRSAHAAPQSCAVGSVKSLIGHTKAAAGISGLIKAALSLYHKVLPPTAGVKSPNPREIFNNGPLYVNTRARPWINSRGPCRAGVSAFGFGGTNFHAVLEEYADDLAVDHSCALENFPSELFCWSAISVEELLKSTEPLRKALERGARPNLRDLAYTIDLDAIKHAKEKSSGAVCLAIVAKSIDDLNDKLTKAAKSLAQNPESINDASGIYYSARPLAKDGKIAFLFPGQGSQRPDMLRDLTIIFPEMRDCFRKADQTLNGRLPKRLSEYIFPVPSFTAEEEEAQRQELIKTNIAQPALGAVEIGLSYVLRSFGIAADMVAGHSSGEYAALAAAGVFSEEALYDALYCRGTAILEMNSDDLGTMLAVMAGPGAIEDIIRGIPQVYMANFNSPAQTVLSGNKGALEELQSRFKAKGIECQFIPVNCAFHSPYMNPARDRLARKILSIKFNKPRLALYSNSLASLYPADKEDMISCLSSHLVGPVRFTQEIEAMFNDGARIFVELGPRNVLTNLTKQILAGKRFAGIACNGSASEHDITQLHHAIAQLLAEGVAVRLERLFQGRGVKKLNISGLKADDAQPHAGPTTWMVASDRAWPAREIRPVRTQIQWEQSFQTAENTEADLSLKNEQLRAYPSARLPANPPVDSKRAEVMIKHQKLMARFLEQQKDIMLNYLQGASTKTGSLPEKAPGQTVSKAESTAPTHVESVTPDTGAVSASAKKEDAPLVTKEAMEKTLVALVSERTGYPPEMLGLDLNMEADLGIDSIKRVEILAAFRKSLPDAPADITGNLTAVKSLRDLIDRVAERYRNSPDLSKKAADQTMISEGVGPIIHMPREEVSPRCIISLDRREFKTASKIKVPEGVVIITDDERRYAQTLQAKIQELGGKAVIARLSDSAAQLSDNSFAVDLSEPAGVEIFIDQLRQRYSAIGGIVHLLPLRGAPSLETMDAETYQRYLNEEVKSFFYLLRYAAADLTQGEPKWVVSCAKLSDKAISGKYPIPIYPWRGANTGIIKTVAMEWPQATCKGIDIDAKLSQEEFVSYLLAEIQVNDNDREIYYNNDARWLPQTRVAALNESGSPRIEIGKGDVILVTGGARGITAEISRELAKRYQPTIILAGRSAWPDDEPASSAGIVSPEELKKFLIETLRQKNKEVTPSLVEEACGRILADRQMRATKSFMEEAGAKVFYYQADVSDKAAFALFIDTVYKVHGRIDGVIHGAGIIDDKLLQYKSPESFSRVFDTKATSAFVLSTRLKSSSLKFLVFFSSIAGCFGNRGQSDYSAANEVLNRLAMYLDDRWPGRVVAINWGPWEKVGMANPALQRQFIERGIIPINPSSGSKAFFNELFYAGRGQPVTVVGNGPWIKDPGDDPGKEIFIASAISLGSREPLPLLGSITASQYPDGSIEIIKRLDPAEDLYLQDHSLDGKPVLPAAMAIELMAEAIGLGWPDWKIAALKDVRVLKGIILKDNSLSVRILVRPNGNTVSAKETIELDASIADIQRREKVFYRTTAVLRRHLSDPARYEIPSDPGMKMFPKSPEEAYDKWLFHGPRFQCIKHIEGVSGRGILATIAPSSPKDCLAGNPRGNWFFDPVILDSGPQLVILWAREYLDITPLPSRFKKVCLFKPFHLSPNVRCYVKISDESKNNSVYADVFFIGQEGQLLGTVEGLESIGSKSLNRLAVTDFR